MSSNVVGQSNGTPWKEFCFQELLESFMDSTRYKLMKAIKNRIPAVFHVYDLYAGTGINSYGDSSTVIFYNKLNCVGGMSGMYNLTAVEKDKNNYKLLEENIGSRDITVINDTASNVISNIPESIRNTYGENPIKAVGVVFLDPNGVVKEPEYKSLIKLSRECPGIAIVANLSVTTLHRCRGINAIEGFKVYNEIGQINNWQRDMEKTHCYVRAFKKGGSSKWTIAVLTNKSLHGINGALYECGFYNIKNEAGARLLSQVDKRQMTIEHLLR